MWVLKRNLRLLEYRRPDVQLGGQLPGVGLKSGLGGRAQRQPCLSPSSASPLPATLAS
jgi:hypothetical protein